MSCLSSQPWPPWSCSTGCLLPSQPATSHGCFQYIYVSLVHILEQPAELILVVFDRHSRLIPTPAETCALQRHSLGQWYSCLQLGSHTRTCTSCHVADRELCKHARAHADMRLTGSYCTGCLRLSQPPRTLLRVVPTANVPTTQGHIGLCTSVHSVSNWRGWLRLWSHACMCTSY